MIAVLDACVLYPPALRDVLMWLAVVVAFEPRWSDDIHAEWIRNVLEDSPDVTPEQLERTRRLMDQVNPKCLVSGYHARIPNLQLPDENDRHILAAAIEAGAAVIVTFNLSDFPHAVLQPFGLRALSPDAFLETLFHDNPARFLRGIQRHRASLKNPPKTTEEYLASLAAWKRTKKRSDVRQSDFNPPQYLGHPIGPQSKPHVTPYQRIVPFTLQVVDQLSEEKSGCCSSVVIAWPPAYHCTKSAPYFATEDYRSRISLN